MGEFGHFRNRLLISYAIDHFRRILKFGNCPMVLWIESP